jgi:hypothetical protein
VIGPSLSAAQSSPPEQALRLTVDIISEEYCANGPDMATLQMRLRLRYTNAGTQKLILYRGDDLFYQAKIRARAADSGARPYEVVVLHANYLEVENEPVEQSSPGKLFVILKPGAGYEIETAVGVGLKGRNVARDRHAILAGEHTLQLSVSTWYRSRSLAEKLRRQWQREGLLWFDPVFSNLITFSARPPQSLSPCK